MYPTSNLSFRSIWLYFALSFAWLRAFASYMSTSPANHVSFPFCVLMCPRSYVFSRAHVPICLCLLPACAPTCLFSLRVYVRLIQLCTSNLYSFLKICIFDNLLNSDEYGCCGKCNDIQPKKQLKSWISKFKFFNMSESGKLILTTYAR